MVCAGLRSHHSVLSTGFILVGFYTGLRQWSHPPGGFYLKDYKFWVFPFKSPLIFPAPWTLGAYSTVAVIVEDLGGQRDAIAGLHFCGNVLPHPHAVVLIAGNVQLRVVHLQGLEEANHILLFLFDLQGGRKAQISELRALQLGSCACFNYV